MKCANKTVLTNVIDGRRETGLEGIDKRGRDFSSKAIQDAAILVSDLST
jgi:hypothetical protein